MTDRAVLVGGLSLIAGSLLLNHFQGAHTVQNAAESSAVSSESSAGEEEQYPEEIKHEIHSRVKTFFSEQGFKKLQDSFVIVSNLTNEFDCCGTAH